MTVVGKELRVICEQLKKDESYFYAWQSNIAMAFFDEYRNKNPNIMTDAQKHALHKISNDAAIRFLNQLIKDGLRKD